MRRCSLELVLPIVFALTAIVVVAIVVTYLVRARAGQLPVRLSHVKCSTCGAEFDYAWHPGFSLTSVRLVNSRGFACPACGTFGLFNILDSEVDPETHRCSIRIGPG